MTKKPLFGVIVSLVAVIAIVGACFGLKAIGDHRSDDVYGARSAAGMGEVPSEKALVMGVVMTNDSSVPIQLAAQEVKHSQWAYDTYPDSNAPLGLTGMRIEPGKSSWLALQSKSSTDMASFKMLVTPMSGSSTGKALPMYQFRGEWKNVDGVQEMMWLWPTASGPSRYSLETRECGPRFVDEVGRYDSAKGAMRVVATVDCTANGSFIGTSITFTDSLIPDPSQPANQTK